MFKFNLPKFAVVDVQQPTGAVMRMVHLGNGEFASEIPPIVLDGFAPVAEQPAGDLVSIAWDSAALGDRAQHFPCAFVFDAQAGVNALLAAEATGEVAAISMMQRIRNADAQASEA